MNTRYLRALKLDIIEVLKDSISHKQYHYKFSTKNRKVLFLVENLYGLLSVTGLHDQPMTVLCWNMGLFYKRGLSINVYTLQASWLCSLKGAGLLENIAARLLLKFARQSTLMLPAESIYLDIFH